MLNCIRHELNLNKPLCSLYRSNCAVTAVINAQRPCSSQTVRVTVFHLTISHPHASLSVVVPRQVRPSPFIPMQIAIYLYKLLIQIVLSIAFNGPLAARSTLRGPA
ncbi:hypothetical protein CY34DRAFT_199919 [Suillus luteus UH-Slu-Lm8-n1]|uniref:Uncharacterized protein n=1 Tax=Suillus luteus UH-Slu-Lm8-n1 TaxID=930992 RepID=A0A0D0AI91_9AGAM|nr:hypothetical protein CY34DRAFT_199919 [Suillus luteus UH-Slu-Lm8-n1]